MTDLGVRLGLVTCHWDHAECCHCGQRWRRDKRIGTLCGCPTVKLDLIGGPGDGLPLRMPQSIAEERQPLLTDQGPYRHYRLARQEFGDKGDEPVFIYRWNHQPEESPMIIASFSA